MPAKSANIVPRCKAMLVCDQVIIERETEKYSIIGSFTEVTVSSASPYLGVFSVFLLLTEGTGENSITMQLHDLKNDEVVFETVPVTMTFESRLDLLAIVVRWPSIEVVADGAFDVVAYANGDEIERQSFVVHIEAEEES
jgi:hypothetical protein